MFRKFCLGFLACLLPVVANADILPWNAVAGTTNGITAGLEQFRNGATGQSYWPWAVTGFRQNDDGYTDLLVTTHSNKGSCLLRQDANGQFTNVTDAALFNNNVPVGWTPYTLLPSENHPLIVDIDGDGRLDIVSSGETAIANKNAVLNRGSYLELGSAVSKLRTRFGYQTFLDADQRIDFTQNLTDFGKNRRYDFINTGTGFTRTDQIVPIPADLPADIIAKLQTLENEDPAYDDGDPNTAPYPANGANANCGPRYFYIDIDGDGDLDLLLRYQGSYASDIAHRWWRLLRNDNGTLVDISATCGIPGVLVPLTPVRDMNGDGLVDFLMSNGPLTGKTAGLYLQQPGGTFAKASNADLTNALADADNNYICAIEYHDLDRDGDMDLVLNTQRQRRTFVFDNRNGVYAKVLHAVSWDGNAYNVCDMDSNGMLDVVCGGPPYMTGVWSNGGYQSDTQVTIYYNTCPPPGPVEPPPPPPPPPAPPIRKLTLDGTDVPVETLQIKVNGQVIDIEGKDAEIEATSPQASSFRSRLESADPTSPEAKSFLAWVDLSLKTPRQYAFRRYHAALAYRLTSDEKYAKLATDDLPVFMDSIRARVASGRQPAIADDSYLNVGSQIEDLVTAVSWCGHRISEGTLDAVNEYGEQTIFNVWNPTKASYYDRPFRWSGWSINSPGNNYHYSFLKATACWAAHRRDGPWLGFLTREKFPKLVAYYQEIPEGGSPEGTGYGSAHTLLFQVYALAKDNFRIDLAGQSSHCANSIAYWANVQTPDRLRFAPIGDQARDAAANWYDYQSALVMQSAALSPRSKQIGYLPSVLSTYGKLRAGPNLVDGLWIRPVLDSPPTELSYAAKGVGHYFARSSWAKDATAVYFQGRSIREGHMAHSLGHFDFWGAGGWLCSTNNVRSKSGIQQTTDWQNLVVLRDATGKLIPQERTAVLSPEVIDAGQTWRASVDLAPAYKLRGLAWRRELTFERPHKLTVHDTCTAPEGISTTWQLNVGPKPIVDPSGDVISAGRLRIAISRPEQPIITIRDWIEVSRRADGSTAATGGWRIEVTGGNEFVAVLEEI